MSRSGSGSEDDVGYDDRSIPQGLIDALDDAIVIASADGVVHQLNSAFEQALGYSKDNIPYAPPLPWVAPRAPGAGTSADLAIAEYHHLAAQARDDPTGRTTIELRHADGHVVHMNVSFSHFNSAGDVLALMRDVTGEVRSAKREHALRTMSIEVANTSDPTAVAEAALGTIIEYFDADVAGVRYDSMQVDVAVASPQDESAIRDGLLKTLKLRPPAGVAVFNGVTGMTDIPLIPEDSVVPDDPVASVAMSLFNSQGALWIGWHRRRRFDSGDLDLLKSLCSQLGQALQRASLDLERRQFAMSIQQSILKNTRVPENAAARYVPALQPLDIGGDWYDLLDLGEGRTGIVIGDCVGRGIGAATTMTKLRAASRVLLLRAPIPVDVLTTLDRFAAAVDQAYCATALIGVIDSNGLFSWASAAHVPGVVIRADRSVQVLDGAQSTPLGVKSRRVDASVKLQRGDRIILFTDGLVERRHEILDAGIQRLIDVATTLHDQSVGDTADTIIDILGGDTGYSDDVALIVFEHRAVPPFHSSLIPGESLLSDFRAALGNWLDNAGVSAPVADDLKLAVNEAVSNSLEHSHATASKVSADNQPSVEVDAFSNGASLTIQVRDHGRWRDSTVSESDSTRGRGLSIIRSVTDSCEIAQTDAGTTLTLTKAIS
ncbi:MAG: SpoIIE family protein phosphatase [Microthrixaceae bacterium]|nr:SpoIIE family protein phosphatase [Microthrixaceae bacterium]